MAGENDKTTSGAEPNKIDENSTIFPIGDISSELIEKGNSPEPVKSEPSKEVAAPEPPPEQPKLETKDTSEDDLTISLDAFKSVLDAGVHKESTKEVKKEVTATPAGEANIKIVPKPGARDYSDIDELDVPLFKNMSNEAFAKLKPIYLEKKSFDAKIQERDEQLKKLQEGKLPESYYEHPEAYKLTDEFNQGVNAYAAAQAIQKHWEQQMINIRKGDHIQELFLNDKKEFQLSEPHEATPEDEVKVAGYLQFAQSQARQIQQDVTSLQVSHANNYKTAVKNIEFAKQRYFKAYLDPKSPMQPIIKQVKEQLPPVFKNNPLADIFAMSFAANYEMGLRLQQLLKQTKVADQVKADKALAGPNAGDINAGGTVSVSPAVTLSAFKERLNS